MNPQTTRPDHPQELAEIPDPEGDIGPRSFDCDHSSGHVFVTGIGRSGTTLVDRLISSHPEAWIASQPLPLLYTEIKREFNHLNGRVVNEVEDASPLTDLFGEHAADPLEFSGFVGDLRLAPDFVERVLALLDGYDGRYFVPSDPRAILADYSPCGLLDLVIRYLTMSRDRAPTSIVGSKETWCEEFIPYFLGVGARVVWVVRDPRAVVSSLHYGKGRSYGGRPRPLLFILRQWRKSVALALANASASGLTAIRYEDLVLSPDETIAKIGAGIGLDDLDKFACGEFVPDANGGEWPANSSFEEEIHGIDPRGVGRFRKVLPGRVDHFVQAACLPEMRSLGYPLEISPDEIPEILDTFVDDTPLERPELGVYQWSSSRADEERRRWRCFRDGRFEPRYCLSRTAFQRLIDPPERGRGVAD